MSLFQFFNYARPIFSHHQVSCAHTATSLLLMPPPHPAHRLLTRPAAGAASLRTRPLAPPPCLARRLLIDQSPGAASPGARPPPPRWSIARRSSTASHRRPTAIAKGSTPPPPNATATRCSHMVPPPPGVPPHRAPPTPVTLGDLHLDPGLGYFEC
jgi:hypothetical protein